VHSGNYLNATETMLLLGLLEGVQPKVVIEIGVQLGVTAKNILEEIKSVETYIGIDVPFHHKMPLPAQQSEVPASPGLYALEDPRFWLLVCKGGSQTLMPADLEPCDAVFIDGDHSFDAVMHDSRLARALVRPGGIIVWHDFRNASVEVTEAIIQLRDEGWPISSIPNSWLAFCRFWRD